MKKLLSIIALSAFFLMPAQAFAWSYDGLNSLNPFTGFRNCNKCEKVKKHKCQKAPKCNQCAKIRITPKRCAKAFD